MRIEELERIYADTSVIRRRFPELADALPGLIAVYKAAKDIIKWAEESGELHTSWCDYENDERTECCCGMLQLITALAQVEGEK